MEEMETKAIRCPQCGSTDVTMFTEDLGKCNNCDANVILPKTKEVVNVKNEFHIEQSAKKDVSYGVIKKEYSGSDFLRKTLISIASDPRTPENILSSSFEPVKVSTEQYLMVDGDASITYSATIGYDKKIEYREWDKYKKEYVKKTKTETEWQPYSGIHSGNYVECVNNVAGDKISIMENQFVLSMMSIKKGSIVDVQDVDFKAVMPEEPQLNAIERAKRKMRYSCEAEAKHNLPGDRNKDFHANGTAKINSITSLSAPVYNIDYTYSGKKIRNKAFAFGNYNRIGGTVDTSQNIMNAVNEKTKIFDIISIVGFSAVALLMLISIIAGWSGLLTLFCLPCIGWKVFTYLNFKKIINNIVQINQENKKASLISKLKQNNLAPLTSGEASAFIAKGKDLPRTKHKIRTAGTILFIVAIILSFWNIF